LIGHLPMVLHPAPARALVIGLGGGATSGAVSRYAGVRVQIVELNAGVREAVGHFAHVNYDVLDQPNVRLCIDDGRNFLRLTGDRFDVVTADIIQPFHPGAGNLYSREYFTLIRAVLNARGLVMQWIGHRPESQYKLIMRTFLEVFPQSTLWVGGTLMVGGLEPVQLSRERFEVWLREARTRESLYAVGLDSFEALCAAYTAGPAEMRRFVGGGPLLTDDWPLVEYFRSLPGGDPPVDLSVLRGDVSSIIQR
jgi:spermidine synthase